MSYVPFPYSTPINYKVSDFNLLGNENTEDSLYELAYILLGNYESFCGNEVRVSREEDVRLDRTIFRLCLDFASKRLNVISQCDESGSSQSGYAEWPFIDAMILFGAELGAAIVRFRPLQFSKEPPLDHPIIPYINELFALEFGWIVGNWMIYHRDHPGFIDKSEDDHLKYIFRDMMSLRSMGKKAQNMFQFHVTNGADSSVLAVFYDSVLSS